MGPEWNNCRVSIITIGSVSPTVGPRNVIAPASNLMSCVWSDPDKVCVCNAVVKQRQKLFCIAKRSTLCGGYEQREDSQQQVYLPRAAAYISYRQRLTCVRPLPPIYWTYARFFLPCWMNRVPLFIQQQQQQQQQHRGHSDKLFLALGGSFRQTYNILNMWTGETWLSHNASFVYNVHTSRDVQ